MQKTINFDQEGISYITPSWQDMQDLSFELSKKILSDDPQFDRIVTLAKGGWPMTRSLVDFLRVDAVASIGVSFYSGINQKNDKPVIYQDIPVSVSGESVLLFDDVADSGESLIFVTEYLKSQGVRSVTTATLFYKPYSKLTPDYYGEETDAWIIFPYDQADTINSLGKKWLAQGLSREEVAERFIKMGFKSEVISYFFI